MSAVAFAPPPAAPPQTANAFQTGTDGSLTADSQANAAAQKPPAPPQQGKSNNPWDSFGNAADAWNTAMVGAKQKYMQGLLTRPPGPVPAAAPSPATAPPMFAQTSLTPQPANTPGVDAQAAGPTPAPPAPTAIAAPSAAVTPDAGKPQISAPPPPGLPPAETINAWADSHAQYPGYEGLSTPAGHAVVQQYFTDAYSLDAQGEKNVGFTDWLIDTHPEMVNQQIRANYKQNGYDTYFYASAADAQAGKARANLQAPAGTGKLDTTDAGQAFQSYQQAAPGFFSSSLTADQGAALVNQYRSSPNGMNITAWMVKYYPQYVNDISKGGTGVSVPGLGNVDYHYYLAQAGTTGMDTAPATLGLPDPTKPGQTAGGAPASNGTPTPGGSAPPVGPMVGDVPTGLQTNPNAGKVPPAQPPVPSTPPSSTPPSATTPPPAGTPTATTPPPTSATATPTPTNLAQLQQYLSTLLQPGNDIASSDLARSDAAQAAVTGRINSGGNQQVEANAQARLRGTQSSDLATMLGTANEGEQNRLNAVTLAQIQANTSKYQVDANTAIAEMNDATTRLGITTNDALQRWLNDPNSNTLQKYGIDQNVILAKYQAMMQQQGQSIAANAQMNSAALNAATQQAINERNAQVALAGQQNQYNLGVLGLNEQAYNTDSQSYQAYLQLLMMLSPEERAALGGIPQLPGQIVTPGH